MSPRCSVALSKPDYSTTFSVVSLERNWVPGGEKWETGREGLEIWRRDHSRWSPRMSQGGASGRLGPWAPGAEPADLAWGLGQATPLSAPKEPVWKLSQSWLGAPGAETLPWCLTSTGSANGHPSAPIRPQGPTQAVPISSSRPCPLLAPGPPQLTLAPPAIPRLPSLLLLPAPQA